jgi:hypothetical protein
MHQCSFFNDQVVYYVRMVKVGTFVPILREDLMCIKKATIWYTHMILKML